MVMTISLDAAATHVGESVRFIAAVQQIATGREYWWDASASRRVMSCTWATPVGNSSR
ncbi:hypothetical protein PC129_g8037 [Phytophthora cactorum]|uniref:Uncharacterized protein n=1 Tax=Phytophthora cactorum TaxID=29920 RepID=A0A8T1EF33_9STRA|nr:hypothetical protein Pcac1_g16524 [Phytophthora cactorum]KAG2826137.1 hypothetical protein PC112_g9422 [Phytophthora cactorum]KAG2846864.1 hypothetical protein PC111_g1035 [Phytophthora cactorum]KAG2858465.1 hypothetical protein PC113_g9783 [Phytophthora cactorum]KAG2908470.1 hypothetical protein PC114_g10448 [Phytophthora cactorum]